MAERRPPGFNVDLGFYDSDEVLSIPRKVRAAAIGIWTLCGSYSANKLTDGYVSAEALRVLGCTPLIRDALIASTLWDDAGDDAAQFSRWPKWQRTREEIVSFRAAEAERKRVSRASRTDHSQSERSPRKPRSQSERSPGDRHVPMDMIATQPPRNHVDDATTSTDNQTSGWTSAGQPTPVRPEDGNPRARTKTETETELKTSLLTLVEGGVGGDPANLPVAAKAAPVDTRRGSRLPNDWMPSADTLNAMKAEYPHLDLKAIHVEFCDYWRAIPGAKGRKLDWDATWRNRVREIASRNLPARNNHSPPNGIGKPTQKAMGWEAAAQELLAEMENDR